MTMMMFLTQNSYSLLLPSCLFSWIPKELEWLITFRWLSPSCVRGGARKDANGSSRWSRWKFCGSWTRKTGEKADSKNQQCFNSANFRRVAFLGRTWRGLTTAHWLPLTIIGLKTVTHPDITYRWKALYDDQICLTANCRGTRLLGKSVTRGHWQLKVSLIFPAHSEK